MLMVLMCWGTPARACAEALCRGAGGAAAEEEAGAVAGAEAALPSAAARVHRALHRGLRCRPCRGGPAPQHSTAHGSAKVLTSAKHAHRHHPQLHHITGDHDVSAETAFS